MDCWIDSPEHFNCYYVWAHFWGEEPLTLEAIGQLFGMSKQAVQQIEQKAFRKLIKKAIKNGLS